MPELLRESSVLLIAAIVFAFFSTLTIASLVVGFAIERAFPKKRIFDIAPAAGQRRLEAIGNVVFVSVTTAAVTAALATGVVRFGEPSVLSHVATFFALLVGFQVFYYGLHRAMHTKALLPIHRWHHKSQVTSALSGQSVGFGEACLWMLGYVGLPLAMSFVVPISFWGWAGYLAFNVTGNVVGHANVEITAKSAATRNASIFANPFVYHALHHARWTGHYGFQAALMDRLFRSEYGDWQELYDRVSNGEPMTSLQHKGKTFSAPRA